VSQAQDRRLGLLERWRLHLHLRVCEGCRNFQDQVTFLRRAVRSHPALREEDEKKTSPPPT
jgi:hypothetical protein